MPERQPSTRPAEAYVHGAGASSVVIVSARVAAALLTGTDLARYRSANRGLDPEVDAILVALTVCANRWRTASAQPGSQIAPAPEVLPPSTEMSCTEVADVLRITSRAVRLACQAGRLPATQTEAGWRIARTDLDRYRRDQAA